MATTGDMLKAVYTRDKIDANIVEVNAVATTSIDDFKADVSSIDLSTIPADVWAYVTRELTVAAGLTPEQEVKLDTIITELSNVPDDVWNKVIP